MRSLKLKRGSFVVIEAGDIKLTNRQVGAILKISPFADEDWETEFNQWFELLSILANDDNWKVRRAVASNDSAHPDILEGLSLDNEYYVRMAVAENTSTPPRVLKRLFSEEGSDIARPDIDHPAFDGPTMQTVILQNPSVPSDMLVSTFNDESKLTDFLGILALNPSTPPRILKEILRICYDLDDNDSRSNLASNPSSPPELLKTLYEDESRMDPSYSETGMLNPIISTIAMHPSTPLSILQEIADDKDGPQLPLISLASNPLVPEDLLAQLAESEAPDVLESAYLNPRMGSLDPARLVASDPRPEIRAVIARNTSTPSKELEKLALDENTEVVRAVAMNENTPPETLEFLYSTYLANYGKMLTHLANYGIQIVAMNPSTPEWVLSKIYYNHDESLTKWLAWNPSAPIWLLSQLAKRSEAGAIDVARNKKGERLWGDEKARSRNW